ncbi:MAG: hypothetical protein BAA04_11685 [Firmicutes bacterium ZCTH02-B6]|nr:MAG: hypothetical protein BAA04_11685 [Firmicutes bacterium ZCTH02-B6]
MRHVFLYLVMVAVLAGGWGEAVEAQSSGDALPPVLPELLSEAPVDVYHRVAGFRSVRFGMTAEEVRQAIRRDFGVGEDEIESLLNLEQGTLVLAVTVPSLPPGPGPASVYYILGASTERLMYINVVWSTSEDPTDAEREQMVIAGLQLGNYFLRLQWRPEAIVTTVVLGPGEVVVFAGVDPDGAGVQVILRGVPMADEAGQPVPLSGPAMLQVAYAADFGQPDVITIEPGAF